jgi:hypothetical protein
MHQAYLGRQLELKNSAINSPTKLGHLCPERKEGGRDARPPFFGVRKLSEQHDWGVSGECDEIDVGVCGLFGLEEGEEVV